MFTILIGGYYGAGNIGDEAILECMLGDLRETDKDLKFIITSWKPEWTRQQYNVDAVYWRDIPGLFSAVQRSDLVILGGGGLFQDYWGIDPSTYLRTNYWDITAYGSIPLLAKLYGIPAMIYAAGIGPLKTDLALEHTRMAFENVQVSTLRDQESLGLLRKSGFDMSGKINSPPQILADPVFSLVSSTDDDNFAAEYMNNLYLGYSVEFLGVSLRYWDFSGSNREWLEKIAEGLNQFLESTK